MMTSAEKAAGWWQQYSTIGNLLISVLVIFAGTFSAVYTLTAEQERRWARMERELAIVTDRQNMVMEKNKDQDELLQKTITEQHIYFERFLIQLETNAQKLSYLERNLNLKESHPRADRR